jgi:hypothetical protein
MANKIKPHGFRVGDVVEEIKPFTGRKRKLYVVSGTKGWIHSHGAISLCREIGAVSLLTNASEYRLVKRRESVGRNWWLIFKDGEK